MNRSAGRTSYALSPRGVQSPRSSQLRRLDTTREVRHGSVVIERNEALTSMDPSKDPLSKVKGEGLFLNLTNRTNDTITVEWSYCPSQSWTPIDHFLLEHSCVTNPDFIHERRPSNERQFVLHGCTPGTNYFFVISSIDVYGKVIIRSKQLTVQSSAPIDRPILKVKKDLPDCITIEWNRPVEYGDGFISEYHLKVDGKFYTNIRSTKTSFDFIECRPLQNYTFRIQAISLRHDCNSEWSNVLEVACPAALPITLKRLRPKTINTVQVGWNLPTCVGGARVKEFKVYFKEASTYELYNDQSKPDPDKIFGHRHAIVRSYKPDQTMSSIIVEPNKNFWAILKAEVTPEGCPPVITEAVRVKATIRPVAPDIKIAVYGQEERMGVNREITDLLDKRDKINRRKDIFQSSDIVRGAELKNEEVQNMNVMLYQMENRLQELVRIVNKLTGFVPVVLTWEKPQFDEFSEPVYYRINVDDHSYQDPLPLDYTQHSLKLDVEKETHSISLTTLSWHPVGHSDQSNVEVVSAKEFRPNRFFCYFTTHKKNVSWPGKGGCRLEDCLAYEKKLTSKNNVHRGLLKTRVTPKPFKVMGVHDATWQSLIRHFGAKKSTIILFWTKWCVSSQNMLEFFSTYAHRMKDKFLYLACCVKSGEDILSHRKSVIELLNEKQLRVRGNIRHCCACHPAPDLPHNTVEKMEKASIPASFDLAGVPTFVMLDIKGQVSWQGRVAADNDETFFNYMNHVMSQVDEQACPNIECQQCKEEQEGVTYKPTEDHQDHQDGVNNDESRGSEETNCGSHDKFSLDEFHLLHSRLHGKALEDAEKTQDESYTKVGSLSPRKEWLERRRANANKNKSPTEPEKMSVRFVEVSGEDPRQQAEATRLPTASKPTGDFRNYEHRNPGRDYRSPNNGYQRPNYGYGTRNMSTPADTPREIPLQTTDKPRRDGYKYSSINYHASQLITIGDQEKEVEKEHEEMPIIRNNTSNLGYQSTSGTPKWSSAIKAKNVSRDTSRGNGLSSSRNESQQQDEIFDFLLPSEIVSKNGGSYNNTRAENTKENVNQPYIYRRPSTQGASDENDKTRASKSGKKDKYSHIKSRYSKHYYKPEKGNRSGTVSAKRNKRWTGITGNDTPSWRGNSAVQNGGSKPSSGAQGGSKSARYSRPQYAQ